MKNEVVAINGVEVEFSMMSDGFSVTSLDVAKVFEKQHKNVIRDIEMSIEKNKDIDAEIGRLNFELSYYVNKQNKKQKLYLLDKEAFTFLALGFTGSKAYRWQREYIKAFDKMEAMIRVGFKESEQLLQANKDLLFIVKELGFSENSFKPTKDGRIKTKVRKSCLTADTSKDKEKRLSNVEKANKVVTQIAKTGLLIASRNLNPYEKYLKKIGGKDPRALI